VTSVYYQIRQIVISPSGTFLAICTEHTVHVAVLPDSSRLADGDRSPLKLKTYQLGPTIHVIPESPLASVLWHPLAVATSSTDCLVTVTAEAAVRVWELDRSNHWTFERPELAIDLRKLADAVSCDQDFEPCGFGKTRGFSVDDFDMEVSAACFGGRAGEQEDAWASMTLWTAMRNGDIYALCPLLPSKWTPTSTTIPSLTTSAVSRMASIAAEDADADDRRAADQQYEWVQEIDDEDPLLLDASDPSERYEVRLRPQNPSAIPRLQGPFELPMEDEAIDIEVSDIFVFPSHLEVEDILSGEDDYEEWGTATPTGIPFTTVCLASTDNKVYFALELEGVSCQWLPKKGRSTFSLPSSDARELPLVESVILDGTLPGHASSSWPVFTGDPVHSHSLFFTTATQIYSLSLNEWITRLAVELSGDGPADPALKTRLDTSCQSQICVADKVIEINESPKAPLSAPTLVDDAYLGYFMLTCTPTTAYSAFFDQSHLRESIANPWSPERTSTSLILAQSQLDRITAEEEAEDGGINLPTRAPYAPSNVLYANATHPLRQLRDRIPANHKKAMTERPMRLSPACLDVMTSAHRTIAVQTAELEQAAAELFRRCERLRDELGDQVKQMSELADRLQHLHGLTHDGDDDRRSHEARIREAQERQHRLVQRYEVLRRKVGRVGTARQELSSKEVAWIEEIETLGRNVGVVEPENEKVPAPLDSRFDTVSSILSVKGPLTGIG